MWVNWVMTLKLNTLKKRHSIVDTMTLPVSTQQKERYKRILNELAKRELESLHTLTRAKIDQLLDEVESQLNAAG